MNKYYVYIYLDSKKPGCFKYNNLVFDYEPIWVGKGSGNRYKVSQHISKKNNASLRKRIKEKGTKGIIVNIAFKNLCEDDAYRIESEYIKSIGRLNQNSGPLFNESDGGKGNNGYKHSKERIKKISNAMKGKSVGEKCNRSKLTKKQVVKIRELKNILSISKLAKMYDVSTYCIWAIVNNINWKI